MACPDLQLLRFAIGGPLALPTTIGEPFAPDRNARLVALSDVNADVLDLQLFWRQLRLLTPTSHLKI